MNWSYAAFADGDIHVVIRNAERHLMGLTDAQSESAKVATSNQSHGDARSFVVWNLDGDAAPAFPTGKQWTSRTWETDHDYSYLYQAVVNALNRGSADDGAPISPAAAYHSLVCMSNMSGGIATVTLYFRV